MLYSFDTTVDFCKRISCLFNENIQTMLLESKSNVRNKMINLITRVCIRTISTICYKCKLEFIKKILNVLINSCIKNCNNSITNYKIKTTNKKFKKITHL